MLAVVVRRHKSIRLIAMRKLKLFNIALICLMLVGCVSASERDLTISELRNNEIIDKSWELIDTWTESATPVRELQLICMPIMILKLIVIVVFVYLLCGQQT